MADDKFKTYAALIEARLQRALPALSGELGEAVETMRYTLSSGGKRVRPLLTLLFCDAAGGDPERALSFACAVELVHTYSLIHDDLPCMDDDALRRGKPASHVVFGEGNAVLAGDALLTHAFSLVADAALNGEVPLSAAVRAVGELSRLAGVEGMVGGQFLDLKYENTDPGLDLLYRTDALKTGALIEAACVLGLFAAGAGEAQVDAARVYAKNLGLAFQIEDDLIEYEEDGAASDEKNGKATYVRKLGPDEARAAAAEFTKKSVEALSVFGERGETLRAFSGALLGRKN